MSQNQDKDILENSNNATGTNRTEENQVDAIDGDKPKQRIALLTGITGQVEKNETTNQFYR